MGQILLRFCGCHNFYDIDKYLLQYSVKPRFTAPRFTVNPDLPHLQPEPFLQIFTRRFTFLSYKHVILCKEASMLVFRHQTSLSWSLDHMHALHKSLLGS